MENNDFSNPTPTVSSRLVAILIVSTVLAAAVFVGGFIAAGMGNKESATLTPASSIVKTDEDTIRNAEVKTWHFDAGRQIFPVLQIMYQFPTDSKNYAPFCAAVAERVVSLRAIEPAPVDSVDQAFKAWTSSLSQVKADCDAKDYDLMSKSASLSGAIFDTFYKEVSKFDPDPATQVAPVAPAPTASSPTATKP